MEFYAHYDLDSILESNIVDIPALIEYANNNIMLNGKFTSGHLDAGCSAFTVKTPEGDAIYGRNFDYKMYMAAVLLRTNPQDGYKSIGVVDSGWAGYGK